MVSIHSQGDGGFAYPNSTISLLHSNCVHDVRVVVLSCAVVGLKLDPNSNIKSEYFKRQLCSVVWSIQEYGKFLSDRIVNAGPSLLTIKYNMHIQEKQHHL